MMKLHTLTTLADRHGLLARRDVVPRACSGPTWMRALRSGILRPVQPGVALVHGYPVTENTRVRAAQMSAGRDCLVSGITAARLYGVSIPDPAPIHLISPHRGRNRGLRDAILHRPLDLFDLEPSMIDGIAVSPPFRTLLDTAAWNRGLEARVLEHFLVSGDLTIRSSWRGLFTHARQGRPGITRLRMLLNRWALDNERPESVLEARMLSLCFRHRLPPFEFQAEIGPFRVDFLWRDERTIVECDGFAFHGLTRDAFERDRHRDAQLQALGYTVWRFSFQQITGQSSFVASTLKQAFRRIQFQNS
jgi:very-short-patch-repair endonuclease